MGLKRKKKCKCKCSNVDLEEIHKRCQFKTEDVPDTLFHRPSNSSNPSIRCHTQNIFGDYRAHPDHDRRVEERKSLFRKFLSFLAVPSDRALVQRSLAAQTKFKRYMNGEDSDSSINMGPSKSRYKKTPQKFYNDEDSQMNTPDNTSVQNRTYKYKISDEDINRREHRRREQPYTTESDKQSDLQRRAKLNDGRAKLNDGGNRQYQMNTPDNTSVQNRTYKNKISDEDINRREPRRREQPYTTESDRRRELQSDLQRRAKLNDEGSNRQYQMDTPDNTSVQNRTYKNKISDEDLNRKEPRRREQPYINESDKQPDLQKRAKLNDEGSNRQYQDQQKSKQIKNEEVNRPAKRMVAYDVSDNEIPQKSQNQQRHAKPFDGESNRPIKKGEAKFENAETPKDKQRQRKLNTEFTTDAESNRTPKAKRGVDAVDSETAQQLRRRESSSRLHFKYDDDKKEGQPEKSRPVKATEKDEIMKHNQPPIKSEKLQQQEFREKLHGQGNKVEEPKQSEDKQRQENSEKAKMNTSFRGGLSESATSQPSQVDKQGQDKRGQQAYVDKKEQVNKKEIYEISENRKVQQTNDPPNQQSHKKSHEQTMNKRAYDKDAGRSDVESATSQPSQVDKQGQDKRGQPAYVDKKEQVNKKEIIEITENRKVQQTNDPPNQQSHKKSHEQTMNKPAYDKDAGRSDIESATSQPAQVDKQGQDKRGQPAYVDKKDQINKKEIIENTEIRKVQQTNDPPNQQNNKKSNEQTMNKNVYDKVESRSYVESTTSQTAQVDKQSQDKRGQPAYVDKKDQINKKEIIEITEIRKVQQTNDPQNQQNNKKSNEQTMNKNVYDKVESRSYVESTTSQTAQVDKQGQDKRGQPAKDQINKKEIIEITEIRKVQQTNDPPNQQNNKKINEQTIIKKTYDKDEGRLQPLQSDKKKGNGKYSDAITDNQENTGSDGTDFSNSALCGLYFCSIPTDLNRNNKKKKNKSNCKKNKSNNEEEYKASLKKRRSAQPERDTGKENNEKPLNYKPKAADDQYRDKQKQIYEYNEQHVKSKALRKEASVNSFAETNSSFFCGPHFCSIPSDHLNYGNKNINNRNFDEQSKANKNVQVDVLTKTVKSGPNSSKPIQKDEEFQDKKNKKKNYNEQPIQSREDNSESSLLCSTNYFCGPHFCSIPSDQPKTDKNCDKNQNYKEQYTSTTYIKQTDPELAKSAKSLPSNTKSKAADEQLQDKQNKKKDKIEQPSKSKTVNSEQSSLDENTKSFFCGPHFCSIPSDQPRYMVVDRRKFDEEYKTNKNIQPDYIPKSVKNTSTNTNHGKDAQIQTETNSVKSYNKKYDNEKSNPLSVIHCCSIPSDHINQKRRQDDRDLSEDNENDKYTKKNDSRKKNDRDNTQDDEKVIKKKNF